MMIAAGRADRSRFPAKLSPTATKAGAQAKAVLPLLSRRFVARIELMPKNNKEAHATAQTAQGGRLILKRFCAFVWGG
jgi:hypothetical protein